MTDYDELERLAREATPGPWETYSAGEHPELNVGTVAIEGGHIAFCEEPSDTAYIAAASPDVILALLEERRVLRGGGKVVTAYWKGTRLLERDALLHLAMRRHEHSDGCDGCLNVQRQTQAALDDAPVSEVLDEDRLARALASPDAMAALSRFGDGVTTTDDIADAILAALQAEPARAEEGAS